MATRDGRYIVFLSDRDGRDRVWRMEPDGGRQTPLTEGPEDHHPVETRLTRYTGGEEIVSHAIHSTMFLAALAR